ASAGELTSCVPVTHEIGGESFSFSVKATSDLSKDQRDQIWRIFEDNMYELYSSSSFGWNPKAKKAEMFDQLSRFLIVQRDEGDDTRGNPQSSGAIAYTMFRFDSEEYQDVVYCYELQVSEDARRCGLGRLLTQTLSDIGAQWGMTKVMLTAFKANHAAMAFYKSIGFVVDDTSPDFLEDPDGWTDDECDYSILSRRIT
ncbi:acyl-CoA N-acyltransferase, partial [Melanogaster broomeanus]